MVQNTGTAHLPGGGVMITQSALAFKGHLPHIDVKELAKTCRMKIKNFHSYGKKVETRDGVYYYQDNGSDILAVAHLDSVLGFKHFGMVKMSHDTRYYSTNLDDRLGAYLILKYLPKLGIKFDVLLTENEEKMRSTAAWFVPPVGKKYKWMFQFDRQGADAVAYQYMNLETTKALREVGLANSRGMYSDICELEHLGCAGFNFGTGYYLNHTIDSFASKKVIMSQVSAFLKFYQNNKNRHFIHMPVCNTFSFIDGFEYDPTVKDRNFTRDEYTRGLLLIEESEANESFSYRAFTTRMTAGEFVRMLSHQQLKEVKSQGPPLQINPPGPQRGSEDLHLVSFESKMGVALIQHPEIKPGSKSPYDVVKEALGKGKLALSVDKCLHCGNEYEIKGNTIHVTCPTCRLKAEDKSKSKADPLPLTNKSLKPESMVNIRETTVHIGAIKTKLPINLGGVRAEYQLVNRDSKNKSWSWVSTKSGEPIVKKQPVGFAKA